jgi:hypothetical protein
VALSPYLIHMVIDGSSTTQTLLHFRLLAVRNADRLLNVVERSIEDTVETVLVQMHSPQVARVFEVDLPDGPVVHSTVAEAIQHAVDTSIGTRRSASGSRKMIIGCADPMRIRDTILFTVAAYGVEHIEQDGQNVHADPRGTPQPSSNLDAQQLWKAKGSEF